MSDVELVQEPWGFWIHLTNPPVNALRSSLVSELADALEQAVAASPPIVVLSGEGRCFSAGADLKETQSTDVELAIRQEGNRRLETVLQSVPFPTIAAVHGACIGGALNLIANCDLRVARDDAFFALPEVTLGRAGGSANLRGFIGEGTVRWLALTGKRMSAVDALNAGLVDHVVPSDEWPTAVGDLAAQMSESGREALYAVKESLDRARDVHRHTGRWIEQQVSQRLSRSGLRRAWGGSSAPSGDSAADSEGEQS